jgi:hypothetical protein
MSPSAMSPEPAIGPAGSSIEQVAICGYMAQMCCDTTVLLSDATGTLSVQNNAGSISAADLRRLCW